MGVKPFPQNKKYELSLLTGPQSDFRALETYIEQYIKIALGHFELTPKLYNQLLKDLRDDIAIAAKQYLESPARDADYTFSTYFSWFVSERLNKIKGLKRKAE